MILEAAASNDDIGVIVRAHLELERAMIRALEKKYPKYEALKHDSFAQHLRALRALGAEGAIFQIADELNKIRNGIAHLKKGIKTSISETDIRNLCSQASGAFGGRQDVLGFVCRLGDEGPKPLKEFSKAKQLLVISAMAAMAIDTIPQREAEHSHRANISRDA
ncbi:MAG: hypothetical protein WC807_10950 [Hyphomicrobium sp.]|jgi:hypothetical protein